MSANYCYTHSLHCCILQLDGFEIRPGKKLKANISVANVRLFVGNIPKTKSREEIMEAFQPLTGKIVKASQHLADVC